MNLIDTRRRLRFLPLPILLFLALGCQLMETVESTKIPQSEIEQTYDVSASRERTAVTAHFYHGNWGKSVDLDAPSRIEHNAGELPPAAMSFPFGTRYERILPRLETRHSFVYTNNDGQVFRNELSFEPIELPAGEIVVTRSQEVRIPLSRRVAKDEKVSISLKSLAPRREDGNSNAAPQPDKSAVEDDEIFLNDELDESRAVIVLKPKNLKRFGGGKAVLSIEVSRSLALQQATGAGGTMRWSYRATRDAQVER